MARPYRGALVASFVAAVVSSTLDGFTFALLIPFLRLLFGNADGVLAMAPTVVERILNAMIGFALDTDRTAALRNVVLLILATVAIKNVAVYLAGSLGAYVQEGMAKDLRLAFYSHVQTLSLRFFEKVKGGQLVSRIVADIDQVRQLVGATLVSAVQNAILVSVYITILLLLSWRLALITLLLAPAIAVMMRPILHRIRRRVRGALEDRGELTAIVSETVEGARLVKAHGAEEYERRRFENAVTQYFRGVVAARRFAVLAHPVSETLGAGVVLLLLIAGVLGGTPTGGMRPELFIAFMAITLRLLPPVKALSQFPANAEMSLVAADRVFEIMDTEAGDVDPPDAREFPGMRHEIAYENVWVAYDSEDWVLRDVSLRIPAGRVVAIVGPSGAGKSTLVDLLPRFVDPARGNVLIDGEPISTYSRRSLRRSLGIVSQHTIIFNDTVRANIAYGDQEDAAQDAIQSAAKAANADQFIERLPDGYDTILGERGMRLSGGERQRIAIARAILRDPPILIFDEATSSLDTAAERLVQSAIARLLEDRTVLVIAHRLSTVVRADQIVVLDGGRLVERGKHEELAVAGGLYQRLLSLELSGSDR
ncbi:MAG: ABC transporter ATP-binding protein [Gemmatimonadales bacterium]